MNKNRMQEEEMDEEPEETDMILAAIAEIDQRVSLLEEILAEKNGTRLQQKGG